MTYTFFWHRSTLNNTNIDSHRHFHSPTSYVFSTGVPRMSTASLYCRNVCYETHFVPLRLLFHDSFVPEVLPPLKTHKFRNTTMSNAIYDRYSYIFSRLLWFSAIALGPLVSWNHTNPETRHCIWPLPYSILRALVFTAVPTFCFYPQVTLMFAHGQYVTNASDPLVCSSSRKLSSRSIGHNNVYIRTVRL